MGDGGGGDAFELRHAPAPGEQRPPKRGSLSECCRREVQKQWIGQGCREAAPARQGGRGWRTGRREQVALAAGAAAVGRIARGGKEDGAGLAHTNNFYVYCFGSVNIVFMRT